MQCILWTWYLLVFDNLLLSAFPWPLIGQGNPGQASGSVTVRGSAPCRLVLIAIRFDIDYSSDQPLSSMYTIVS